jgi:HEPN domain-containing protein
MADRDLKRAKALLASAEKLFEEGDLAGVSGLAYQAFESALIAFNKTVKGKDVASHQYRMETAKRVFSEHKEDLDFLWEMRNIDFYGNVRPGIDAELGKEKVEKALGTVRMIIERVGELILSKEGPKK